MATRGKLRDKNRLVDWAAAPASEYLSSRAFSHVFLDDRMLTLGRLFIGLPWWLSDKESACNAEDVGSVPGSGRSPEAGNGNPLVLLPGKFHGQRHFVDYSPGGAQRVRCD